MLDQLQSSLASVIPFSKRVFGIADNVRALGTFSHISLLYQLRPDVGIPCFTRDRQWKVLGQRCLDVIQNIFVRGIMVYHE